MIYIGVAIVLALLLIILYRRKKPVVSVKARRRQPEGFQDKAQDEQPVAAIPANSEIDTKVVCPILEQTLTEQIKQREVFTKLPVDITTTPEFAQVDMMIRMFHKNMVDLQCPNTPSLAGI